MEEVGGDLVGVWRLCNQANGDWRKSSAYSAIAWKEGPRQRHSRYDKARNLLFFKEAISLAPTSDESYGNWLADMHPWRTDQDESCLLAGTCSSWTHAISQGVSCLSRSKCTRRQAPSPTFTTQSRHPQCGHHRSLSSGSGFEQKACQIPAGSMFYLACAKQLCAGGKG